MWHLHLIITNQPNTAALYSWTIADDDFIKFHCTLRHYYTMRLNNWMLSHTHQDNHACAWCGDYSRAGCISFSSTHEVPNQSVFHHHYWEEPKWAPTSDFLFVHNTNITVNGYHYSPKDKFESCCKKHFQFLWFCDLTTNGRIQLTSKDLATEPS